MVGGSQAEAQACLTEALQLQARHALHGPRPAWAQLWADCGLDVEGPLAPAPGPAWRPLPYLLNPAPARGPRTRLPQASALGASPAGAVGSATGAASSWDQVRRPVQRAAGPLPGEGAAARGGLLGQQAQKEEVRPEGAEADCACRTPGRRGAPLWKQSL